MKGGGDSAAAPSSSMKEILFDMIDSLCRRYPALEPFYLRRQRFWDVIGLVADIETAVRRENGETATDAKNSKVVDGVQVVRRYASDDSIF